MKKKLHQITRFLKSLLVFDHLSGLFLIVVILVYIDCIIFLTLYEASV
jgi:hypothetical protein